MQVIQLDILADVAGVVEYRGSTENLGTCVKGKGEGGGVIIDGKFTTKVTGSFVLNPPAVDKLTLWTKDLPIVRLPLSPFLNTWDLLMSAQFGIYIPPVMCTV